jgi:protein TonB
VVKTSILRVLIAFSFAMIVHTLFLLLYEVIQSIRLVPVIEEQEIILSLEDFETLKQGKPKPSKVSIPLEYKPNIKMTNLSLIKKLQPLTPKEPAKLLESETEELNESSDEMRESEPVVIQPKSGLVGFLKAKPLIAQKPTKSHNSLDLYLPHEFESLSDEQRVFIFNNLNLIGAITSLHLRYPEFGRMYNIPSQYNAVEFYLHPDGSITNLHLIAHSPYSAFDKASITAVEEAFKDYPRPSESTLIRINVSFINNNRID